MGLKGIPFKLVQFRVGDLAQLSIDDSGYGDQFQHPIVNLSQFAKKNKKIPTKSIRNVAFMLIVTVSGANGKPRRSN